MTPVSSSSLALQLFRGFAPTDNSAATDSAARIQEIVQKTVSGEISPAMKQVATLASTLTEQKQAVATAPAISNNAHGGAHAEGRSRQISVEEQIHALQVALNHDLSNSNLTADQREALQDKFTKDSLRLIYTQHVDPSEKPKFATPLSLSAMNDAKQKYHDNYDRNLDHLKRSLARLEDRLMKSVDDAELEKTRFEILAREYNIQRLKQYASHFDEMATDWTNHLRIQYNVVGNPLIKNEDGRYEWGTFEVREPMTGSFLFGKEAHKGGRVLDPSTGNMLNVKLS